MNVLNCTSPTYNECFNEKTVQAKSPTYNECFNEKTVAALKIHGYTNTALFVKHITRLIKIMNVKSPRDSMRLN